MLCVMTRVSDFYLNKLPDSNEGTPKGPPGGMRSWSVSVTQCVCLVSVCFLHSAQREGTGETVECAVGPVSGSLTHSHITHPFIRPLRRWCGEGTATKPASA